jgi:hypothetical protein
MKQTEEYLKNTLQRLVIQNYTKPWCGNLPSKTSEALQTAYAEVAHLAEGQI